MDAIATPADTANPLQKLHDFGQSPWLDFIRRGFVADGSLKKLVENDGLGGVTSNPSIFEKAMGSGTEYDAQFKQLAADGSLDANALYETMAVQDIQHAADVLRPVYDRTEGADGFVSLEVSPYLALRAEKTVAEARRLWAWVDRPNLMVKVPGTPECVPAIRTLIAEGININVTLLFSIESYQAVANAYLSGLEARLAKGEKIDRIGSVASFFVSRIDTAIDQAIDRQIAAGDTRADRLRAVRGKIAVANARVAYAWYQELCISHRWHGLRAAGARPQRLLWASTGTKDAAYRDVLYVESLIGPDTVNTLPPATMDAFRDHGKAGLTLTDGVPEARAVLAEAEALGLNLASVTRALVDNGVRQFSEAADALLAAVARKRATLLGTGLSGLSARLPDPIEQAVHASLDEWRVSGKLRRLWARDATVWTGGKEAQWLAWLGIAEERLAGVEQLTAFQGKVQQIGVEHVLLLGMGGSSLGPEVFGATFGDRAGWPKLHVLDSTDPQQVKAFESRVELAKTLVIVASKSGSTLEPNILKAYFWDRMVKTLNADRAGMQFVAITDPNSNLQKVAEGDGFRRAFYGNPRIGGRYSVLSNFGLVPAAAIGIDVPGFLASTMRMVRSCASGTPPAANPGVQLGIMLGEAAKAGRDKLTIVASPGIASLGAWLEQLVAESTGKRGLGIIPIDGETLASPDFYGQDRIFAYLRLEDAPDRAQDSAVLALEKAGHAVIRTAVNGHQEIGQQFFLWEFATAVAGSILGIDPFDQPDVEASKIKTRELTDAIAKNGRLPEEAPFAAFDGIKLFADPANAAALPGETLADVLRAHVARAKPGDYFGVLAYVEQNAAHAAAVQTMRLLLRDRTKLATAAEFGPRFLHSTGQAYKGGPNTGVFLQITADDAADFAVPGERFTFGQVKAAQARGDFDVLVERGRRALRVHLGADVAAGLALLTEKMRAALA